MNAIQINFADFVQIQAAQPVTNSKFVAEAFGKRHDNVLSKIDELLTQVPDYFKNLNFKEIEIARTNSLGKVINDKAYQLTKDGFMLLVMGFTGKAAMQIKIAYIEAFNAMAEQLKHPVSGSLQTDKTSADERTGLRQAVSLLVGRKGIDYSDAYKIVHQRFNVDGIDALSREQLAQAVAYVHALALDKSLHGEILDKIETEASVLSRYDLQYIKILATHVPFMVGFYEIVRPAIRHLNPRLAGRAHDRFGHAHIAARHLSRRFKLPIRSRDEIRRLLSD